MDELYIICMKIIIAALFISIAASGCATQHPKHTQLSDDHFLITYEGSIIDPAEKIRNRALQKAARVTLEHGYKYFEVVASEGDEDSIEMRIHLQQEKDKNSMDPAYILKRD
jgi:hypothetical protein